MNVQDEDGLKNMKFAKLDDLAAFLNFLRMNAHTNENIIVEIKTINKEPNGITYMLSFNYVKNNSK